VVTAFSNGTVAIWDSRRGIRLLAWKADENRVNSASFSRNGKWILTAGRDQTARIWDASSGHQVAVFSGHDGPVMGAEFSPDAKFVATASQDKTVRLWDVATAQEIAVLRGHEGGVNGLALRPDGKSLASASDDGTIRIWNISGIATGTPDALLRRVCATTLAHGLSAFSPEELRAAEPALDPAINTDACQPPGMWSRLGSIFWAGFSG
jgi:WD40 repeat protein